MQITLIILSLIFITSCNSFKNIQETKDITDYYVLVSSDNGYGSGVNIGNGYIFTAAHVVEGDAEINISNYNINVSAKKIKKQHEIYLLYTKLKGQLLLKNYSIQLGQRVFWIQPMPRGEEGVRFYLNEGRINHIGDTTFSIDTPVFPGASGSGVFNNAGELLGIIGFCNKFDSQITYGEVIPIKLIGNLLFNIDWREKWIEE